MATRKTHGATAGQGRSTLTCDVAIIGAGSAGLAARKAAVAEGASTLLIERGPGGTTCARCGCMPSKLLIAAARAARSVREAATFGVAMGHQAVEISGEAVMARVRRERDHFVAGVLEDVDAIPARERISGEARFTGAHRLVVDDKVEIEAKAIVIAVGAAPLVPDLLKRACGERVLTHETVFEIETLPKTLAVLGAGPQGLELAVAFARLGVRVSIFDEGQMIGGLKDPQVELVARKTLGTEFTLHMGVHVEASRRDDGDVQVHWQGKGGDGGASSFEYVLSAAGRPPQIDGLDLKAAGLTLDEQGLPHFDPRSFRCGKSAIFIVGDANGYRPVLHEASAQGEIAGRLAGAQSHTRPRALHPQFAVAFTDPDIAVIGGGFDPDQAATRVVGASEDSGRARIEGHPSGLLHIYARRKDEVIVGGEMFGRQVEHLAHLLGWIVQLGLTVEQALDLVFYHPTMEEEFRGALRDLRKKLPAPASKGIAA